MRLALALECPLEQQGGVEILVRSLVDGLGGTCELFLVSRDTWVDLRTSRLGALLRGHFQWEPEDKSRAQVDRLIEWVRGEKIEIVHFHHGGTYGWNSRSWSRCAITALARAGVRCVTTNHGAFGFWLFVGAQRSLPYRLAALLLCWPAKLRQVASVGWEATVSRHDYRAVRHWFFPVRSRFRQIYHSILEESTLPDLPKRNTILCLGTVGDRKGQPYLVEAFSEIAGEFPDWHLVIAGRHASDGTPARMLEMIHRHQLTSRVEVLTDVSDELARQLLAEAAIFAMPSLAEGLGLSLQEALYGRAACIGSRVGGIQDLILDDTTGILVPPADAASLAVGLKRLIADPALRSRLGETGRQHVLSSGMTRQGMIRRHLELYREVLEA
jgi:glycosyltransferase involved in cell wall biosynthesis